MSGRYMTREEGRNAKSRLTRAINKAKRDDTIEAWQHLYDTATGQLQTWDDEHKAYPDDWHRWRIATDDAHYAIQRLALGRRRDIA